MDKTAKIGLIALFMLSVVGNAVSYYRSTTVALIVELNKGYQQCANDVNTNYTLTPKAKEEPKPIEDGTKK